MAGFSKLLTYKEAIVDNGQNHYSSWRKNITIPTPAGFWYDLSMATGNPGPQYYAAAPLIATQLKRSTDGGINHGCSVTPRNKYLNRFLMMGNFSANTGGAYILLDYLLFYPFIDEGTNDEQFMDNSVTIPRYTDGKGVQIMAVSVAPAAISGATFFINYTNSDGVSGRISRTHTLNTTAVSNGLIVSGDNTAATSLMPFIGLQGGDSGVRSIESITFPAITDVGLLALVLVKPLMTGAIFEPTAPAETTPLSQQNNLIQIKDDAYIQFIMTGQASLNGVILQGEIETVFN
jgi:hypothetical protein